MFTLVQSNRMEALVQVLQQQFSKTETGRSVLESDTVLVYNFGSAKWLKLQLAQVRGISANIEAQLPAAFIWQLFTVLLDEQLPEDADFSRRALTWKLMTVLPSVVDEKEFTPLKHYLAGDGEPLLRRYQLVDKIADLFDQYLIYRPDWLLQWQRGNNPIDASAMYNQHWQPKLWQALIEFTGEVAPHRVARHRADLHQLLLQKISSLQQWPAALPQRISIFGISALPPQHLEIIHAIAQFCQVDLYLLNPCRHYWGDIVPPAGKARKIVKEIATSSGLAEEDYLMVGNPLLASMGQQGREFVDLLLEIDDLQTEDCFIGQENPVDMLTFLQQEILDLEFRGHDDLAEQGNRGKHEVDGDDWSLQIHSCHSRLREVEILRDQLLAMFKRDAGLAPHDVIVMMPDVSIYAPYIDSVFSKTSETDLHIPFSLSDRSLQLESPILTSFLNLLALPRSRLTAPEVMDWLQVAPIARRFSLNQEELETLTGWIAESGVRWGWDGASKQQWQLPDDDQNTWQFGLNRMLLGYAMENAAGLYDGILPYDPVEGGQAELLGKLFRFMDRVWELREELSQPKSTERWHSLVNRLLDDFYQPDRDEELELALIRHTMTEMLEEISYNRCQEPLSLDLVEHYLTEHLKQPGTAHGFLASGVTFCNLVPMRSIPFKTVCLLGMNDEDFPRRSQAVGFDLMSLTDSRLGDRSRRLDDRYLFLEAMLAARNCLYVSYVGRDSKDNSGKVASVLLNELLDYCTQAFILHEDKVADTDTAGAQHNLLAYLVRQHPLQPFDLCYFNGVDSRVSSSSGQWYRANLAAHARRTESHEAAFCATPLPDRQQSETIEIADLTRFFRNPAGYFFREVLGVYFKDPVQQLEDREPFSLTGLDQYSLGESALSALLSGQPRPEWQARMLASGSTLPGVAGALQLDKPWLKATSVTTNLAEQLDTPSTTLSIDFPIGNKRIVGEIEQIHADHLLFYRTGAIKSRQKLDYWIRHLCLACCGHASTTLLISDDATFRYDPVSEEMARDILRPMVELFEGRYRRPMPLIPEVSYSWQQVMSGDNPDRQAAFTAATKSWTGNPYMPGGTESNDPCYARLFSIPEDIDAEFEQVAETVFAQLLAQLDKVES